MRDGFEIGDRVRDRGAGYSFLTPGVSEGTVVAFSGQSIVQVVWDAHDRLPTGDPGWNALPGEIEKV